MRRLAHRAPELEQILTNRTAEAGRAPKFAESEVHRQTVRVTMRDGIALATDLYLPPVLPAPIIAMRTPYGRAADRFVPVFVAFARHGYGVIAQDCRGTGDSEPECWNYCVHEGEDGIDCVDWAVRQDWCDGHLFAFGGSYAAMTQWCMSAHPQMSAIAPEVGGLQSLRHTARRYMFVNGYARAVGKGANRLPVPLSEIERVMEDETMAGGYFNQPLNTPLPPALLRSHPDLSALPTSQAKRHLWARYCALPAPQRLELLKQLLGVSEYSYADYCALPFVLDSLVPYGLHTIPAVDAMQLCRHFRAPALMIAGWYDWNLADSLCTWSLLQLNATAEVAARSRLIITPAAHHVPGYREGQADHPELQHDHRSNIDLLLRWNETVSSAAWESWPRVIYYLMGANEWRHATNWPVPDADLRAIYLGESGTLSAQPPTQHCDPDRYVYDPNDPTPTVGGSVLSYLYPAGSVDVSEVQRRSDILIYTSAVLERDLDVVGPLRLILYVSSSASDTDFVARLSDVFPDGRAIQLQNGILRARYRNLTGDPELLEPHRIYRLEIELWATANRFKAGHRLRLDICSADFPRFDRNTNRGGTPGEPLRAQQTVFHDADHPSHLQLPVLE